MLYNRICISSFRLHLFLQWLFQRYTYHLCVLHNEFNTSVLIVFFTLEAMKMSFQTSADDSVGRGAGGGGGVTSIGGRTRCSREKKRVKRVSKSGVGTEREKGVKNAKKNGRKGYPNRYYQLSIYRHAIKRGKGIGNLRQRVH